MFTEGHVVIAHVQTHLEESIVRHKAHIIKLELVLRLLDNDELSPEEVMEVKELVEDYVERNQVCPHSVHCSHCTPLCTILQVLSVSSLYIFLVFYCDDLICEYKGIVE